MNFEIANKLNLSLRQRRPPSTTHFFTLGKVNFSPGFTKVLSRNGLVILGEVARMERGTKNGVQKTSSWIREAFPLALVSVATTDRMV